MKKLTLKLILVLFAVSITFFACEKLDDDTGSNDCAEKVEKLGNIVLQKSQVYLANPTVSNCNAMKQAVLNQINAAESCVKEYGGSSAEISALRKQYSTLNCN